MSHNLISKYHLRIDTQDPRYHKIHIGKVRIAILKRILLDIPNTEYWMLFLEETRTYSGSYPECISYLVDQLNSIS